MLKVLGILIVAYLLFVVFVMTASYFRCKKLLELPDGEQRLLGEIMLTAEKKFSINRQEFMKLKDKAKKEVSES